MSLPIDSTGYGPARAGEPVVGLPGTGQGRRRGGALGRFWRWWLAELAAVLPRRRPLPRQDYCVAYWRGDALRFASCLGGRIAALGEVALDRRANPVHNAAVLGAVHACGVPLVLRISGDQGLEATDRLPGLAARDLGKILAHRLDSISPWRQEDVHFAVIGRTTSDEGALDVRLAIVPRQTVRAAIRALDGLSLKAAAIDLAGADWCAPPNHDLDPARHPPQLSRLAIATVAGVLIALVLVAGHARQEMQALVESRELRLGQLAELQKQAADRAVLRDRLHRLEREREAIADLRRSRIASAVVLENLTRLLPDTTWLESLTIADAQVTLIGYSRDATELPSLLASTPLFGEPTFIGPTELALLPFNVDDDDGYVEVERFALKATIAPSLALLTTGAEAMRDGAVR